MKNVVYTQEDIEGFRKAHLAALYANLRTLIAHTMDKDNPALGFHGFVFFEDQRYYAISAGSTPDLPQMLSAIGFLEGITTRSAVARQLGDHKTAMTGDTYDPETKTTHCAGCDDGDPTGAHTKKELEENVKAWLGLIVQVASEFYGEHLPEGAAEALYELKCLSLPATANVS